MFKSSESEEPEEAQHLDSSDLVAPNETQEARCVQTTSEAKEQTDLWLSLAVEGSKTCDLDLSKRPRRVRRAPNAKVIAEFAVNALQRLKTKLAGARTEWAVSHGQAAADPLKAGHDPAV